MKKINNLYKFDSLSSFEGVEHFVSTRKGGVSEKPFDGLNLGLHVGDEKKAVLENRKRLSAEVGIKQGNFVYLNQTHGKNILIAEKELKGAGAHDYGKSVKNTDAAITDKPSVCLAVLVADCVPILLFDQVKKVVAVVHAGWRGTMKGIAKSTVLKMKKEFNCNASDIIAGIGPSIGPCCFEVGRDVYYLAKIMYSEKEDIIIKRRGKTFIDLWQANKFQLMRAGVTEINIEIAGICTSCSTDWFYSARKEGETGRFGCGIVLNQ